MLLCGVSDLAEIASLRALEHGIKIVDVYDRNTDLLQFLDVGICRSLDQCESFDVCLITDLTDPQGMFEHLGSVVRPELILVPSILGLKNY